MTQPAGTFANGCLTNGVPVVGFKWIDLSSGATHVANYSYVASAQQLVRTTCVGVAVGGVIPGTPSQLTLSNNITAQPTVWCDGNTSAPCIAFPNTVNMTVTQNNPKVPTSPYVFTLSATVRSQKTATPDVSRPTPLVLLGSGGSCAGGATGLDVENSSSVVVYGQTYINAANAGGCNAMNLDGGGFLGIFFPTYYHAAGTAILTGGTCTASGNTNKCPTTTPYPSAITDPYAGVTPPDPANYAPRTRNNMCQGNNGTAQPGVYAAKLSISSGACTLASGVYIFQQGISVSNIASLKNAAGGVLIYVTGGSFTASSGTAVTLTAMQTGPAPGVVIWQAKSDDNTISMGNFGIFSLNGVIYAPGAAVSNQNLSATLNVTGVVAADADGR